MEIVRFGIGTTGRVINWGGVYWEGPSHDALISSINNEVY